MQLLRVSVSFTSNVSSWELYRGQSLMRLDAPSKTSQSSFKNTPQKGTTLQPGILSARFTTFLYSDDDSCCAIASFRLRMVSISDWSINCHIFKTFLDLPQKEIKTLIKITKTNLHSSSTPAAYK